MARRRALIIVEYETEDSTPVKPEWIERDLAADDDLYIHRVEVLEDNIG